MQPDLGKQEKTAEELEEEKMTVKELMAKEVNEFVWRALFSSTHHTNAHKHNVF